MPTIDDLRSAKLAIRNQLLQLGVSGRVLERRPTILVAAAVANAGRNVHAVGIGRKVTNGVETNEKCVRLYVLQKLPVSLMSPRDVLPAQLDGVPTDIIETAPAFLLAKRATRARRQPSKPTRAGAAATSSAACSVQRKQRQRPVIAGISAGHRDITAGTLGIFCQSTKPGDDPSATYALSNNHVFANVNNASVGDPLYQPGPADGATFQDHFAVLHRYVHMRLGGAQPNRVDAALGLLLANVGAERRICTIGQISAAAAGTEGMLVRKHGRTTGATEGKIDDAEYDALVGMDHNNPNVVALFEDQLRIVTTTTGPIGLGGDSGSAVIDRSQDRIVGLYFAGPQLGDYGIANKIQHVMTELEVTF
jgi:hypothetical protein